MDMQQTIREAKLTYRTKSRGESKSLDSYREAVAYMKGAFDEYIDQEQVHVLLLNRKNFPLGRIRVGIGTVSNALICGREIFRPAILANATAIILFHNHPSGDPMPSRDDRRVTESIKRAGALVGIDLLDHIIVCPMGDDEEDLFFSFQDNNWGDGVSVPVSKPRAEGRCRLEVLPGGAR